MLITTVDNSKEIALIKFSDHEVNNLAFNLLDDVRDLLKGDILNLVIDLSNLNFINSSTVGTLAFCAKKINSVSGKLVLITDKTSLLRIFELTNLSKLAIIVNNIDKAFLLLES